MNRISRLRNTLTVVLCCCGVAPVYGQTPVRLQWEQSETVETRARQFEMRLNDGEWVAVGAPSIVDVNDEVNTYQMALPSLEPGPYVLLLRACNTAGCSEDSLALAFTVDAEPEPEPDPDTDVAALAVRVAMLEAAVKTLSELTQQQASALSQAGLRLTTLERRIDTTLQYLVETSSGGNVQQLRLYLQRIPR